MTEASRLPNPFKLRATYRVLHDFSYYGFVFTCGELLVFTHHGYSRHDQGVVYEFLAVDGSKKDWILYDGESAELTWQYFERV